MGKIVTIADILHHAADNFLASTIDEWENNMCKDKFSCCAIEQAIEDLMGWEAFMYGDMFERIMDGLKAMGLDIESTVAFHPWEQGDLDYNTQHARYGWLKLAAMVAEEQGV